MRVKIAIVVGIVLLSGTRVNAQENRGPKVEVPLDYSYFRFNPQNNDVIRPLSLNGGGAAFAVYFNRHFGIQADFQGYGSVTKTANLPLGSVGCPVSLTNLAPCAVSSSANLFTYNIGPVIKIRTRHVEPFFEVMGGGAHSNLYANLANDCSSFGCVTTGSTPSNDAWDFIIGGGVDIPVSNHFGVRLAQVDYVLTRFGNDFTFGENNQSSFRAQAGFLFTSGWDRTEPLPPNRLPTATCAPSPTTVTAGSGATVSVRATASDPDNDTLSYLWSATGGNVDGTGPLVRWNSTGLAPGAYTINARVDDGRGGTAVCAADVRVEPRPNRPPTVSCVVSPASIHAGDPVRITATAADPDNDQLAFSWQTNGGQVVGSGATVQLNTAGLAPTRYTVAVHVDDGHGGTADCQADVTVEAPVVAAPAPVVEPRLALRSVYFPTDLPKAADLDAGIIASQQQTLTSLAGDFKQYLAAKPDARLTLQGHADPRGTAEYNRDLSVRRVEAVKRFLVQQGIPENSIETRAFGDEASLTSGQVRQLVEQHPNLSPEDKQRIFANLQTVTLAQNRRVDITLNSGQQSVRQFPFNAEDSLTLLSPRAGGATEP